MSILGSTDKFQCCLHFPDEPEKMILGTINGYIYLGKIKKIDEIKSLDLNDSRMVSVLEEHTVLLKLEGVIRSMQFIDKDNIIVLSNQGEILNFNRKTYTYYFIQKYIGNKHHRPWRLLILNENSFITVGNYRRVKHWYKEDTVYKSHLIKDGGYPLFCIDWIDTDKKRFMINGNDGHTTIWTCHDENPMEISSFYSDKNLQKSLLTNTGLILAVNYYGNFFIYKESNNKLEKIEDYEISFSQGNWVQYSEEVNLILVGTDDSLIMISENLDKLWQLDIECKQIINLEDMDLILTSKTIVKPNYSKKREIVDYQDYKYIKIGLVGDSRVGKTCFCKFLDTNEFHDTKSSFGKHVWTIKLDEKRRLLYYDLAGQGSELYTYFPLINDSEIILLFYNGLLKESFDKVLDYYKELRQDCKDTIFYFIQTYSDEDPDRLIKDWYIIKEFKKLGLDFERNLIKIDSSTGNGFKEYKEKVFDAIDWKNTTPVYKSKTYENVEKVINQLYEEGKDSITIEELQGVINLNKRLLEHIILSFKNQGRLEYIEEEKEIIINDEVYEKLHSLLSEKIDGNEGYLKTKTIIECLGLDDARLKYIHAILDYYRNNQICIFFKEDDNENEIIIAERKLKEDLEISDEILSKLPKDKTILYYKNYKLDLASLIYFLSEYSLKIISLSRNKILLKNSDNSSFIKLVFDEETTKDGEIVYFCEISMDKNDPDDLVFEKELIKYFLEKIDKNLIDYSYNPSLSRAREFENIEDELKFILKIPYETPYLDFKAELNTKDKLDHAELLKDIAALCNSSHLNQNIAYLIIGLVEKNYNITKLKDVKNIEILEQYITEFCSNHLHICPTFFYTPIKIYDLYTWQQNKEISSIIPFTNDQKNSSNKQNIFFIRIIRSPNSVSEISKEFHYKKKGKDYYHRIGASWFRLSSHTFRLRDYHRVILRKK